VLGDIPIEQLGITLTHEHLLLDTLVWVTPSEKDGLKFLVDAPVRMENLGELRLAPFISKDNMIFEDPDLMLEELMHYKKAGGNTIVDCTTIGIGRNITFLKKAAEVTGLNIIAGTGFYIDKSHPEYVKVKTVDELASLMVDEIEYGVEGTGIRCGSIGEIGTGSPVTPNEEKVLRAAAHAQEKTRAPINVHMYFSAREGHRVLDILKEEGADLTRVVLSHVGSTVIDPEFHATLARRGCYVEYDSFGAEGYIFADAKGIFEPNDLQRVKGIQELARMGLLSQVVVAHDVSWKIQLRKYGGYGYDHILSHVVPMFRKAGLTDEQINTMLVENPRRMLGF
jgi:phosphotriesterase-related protein